LAGRFAIRSLDIDARRNPGRHQEGVRPPRQVFRRDCAANLLETLLEASQERFDPRIAVSFRGVPAQLGIAEGAQKVAAFELKLGHVEGREHGQEIGTSRCRKSLIEQLLRTIFFI
jgi:hypothetical protein